MKDTTTTIDEIIAGIAGDVYDYADNDDGESDRDEAVYSVIKSHKQAILNWHKQQARSYVLEMIGEDDFEFNNGMGRRQSMQVSRNQLRAEQRAKLDQTLKAIDSKPYIGIDFAIGGQE